MARTRVIIRKFTLFYICGQQCYSRMRAVKSTSPLVMVKRAHILKKMTTILYEIVPQIIILHLVIHWKTPNLRDISLVRTCTEIEIKYIIYKLWPKYSNVWDQHVDSARWQTSSDMKWIDIRELRPASLIPDDCNQQQDIKRITITLRYMNSLIKDINKIS